MNSILWTTRSLLLVAALATLGVPPASAQSPDLQCGGRHDIVRQLTERYGEQLTALALTGGTQHMVELYVSESGSWTLILTTSEAISCLLLSGERWTPVPEPELGA